MPKKRKTWAQRFKKNTPEGSIKLSNYQTAKVENERNRRQKKKEGLTSHTTNQKSNSLTAVNFVSPTQQSMMTDMMLGEEESCSAGKAQKDIKCDIRIDSVTFDKPSESSHSTTTDMTYDEEESYCAFNSVTKSNSSESLSSLSATERELLQKEMCDQMLDIAIYMQEEKELKTLQQFIEPDPDVQLLHPTEKAKLADECIEIGNHFYCKSMKKAIVCYNKALEYVPDHSQALLKRAGVYMQLNWLEQASNDVKAVMEKEPENEKAQWLESDINDRGWDMKETEYSDNFESFFSPGNSEDKETKYSFRDNIDYVMLKAEYKYGKYKKDK